MRCTDAHAKTESGAAPRPKGLRVALYGAAATGRAAESLPGETHRALSEGLGVVCNEGYGMSEVNQMIGNCQRLRPIKPGSMGWDYPGHVVTLVDEAGEPTKPGEVGEICVDDDDPTLFLGYWGRPDLTAKMRLGEHLIRTRDLAVRDDDDYYWYRGRADDLIKSAGYRICPVEIEECLMSHPSVADVGVIGVSNRERGQIVKAFVRLREGTAASDDLVETLRRHVRAELGPHKQPRAIEFVDNLPTTRTGKIARNALKAPEEKETK